MLIISESNIVHTFLSSGMVWGWEAPAFCVVTPPPYRITLFVRNSRSGHHSPDTEALCWSLFNQMSDDYCPGVLLLLCV